MLLPDEFSVGQLVDAAPLKLMLPQSKYEYHFLIGGSRRSPSPYARRKHTSVGHSKAWGTTLTREC